MRFTQRFLALTAMLVLVLSSNLAHAGPSPYANVGSYNDTSYTFTATSTGYVMAYFVVHRALPGKAALIFRKK